MCGYCIESGVTLDYIEREKISDNENLTDDIIPVYIQEGKNIDGAVRSLLKTGNLPAYIDKIFCRIWEMLIIDDNPSTCQYLLRDMENETINNFLSRLNLIHDSYTCKHLSDYNLYFNCDLWHQFVSDKDQLIDDAEKSLDAYYRFWILGKNKKEVDLSIKKEETGVLDPVEATTPEDFQKFYSSLPIVFFSLMILMKLEGGSNIIREIALKPPHDTPDFFGYDLWLQRKAFVFCVKHDGLDFILDNYEDIRLELIYYSILHDVISRKNLLILKNHLLSNHHWINAMDCNQVAELIDKSEAVQ